MGIAEQTADGVPQPLARLTGVRGNTTRTVFVSADARAALADYLQAERPDDAGKTTIALFCSAISIASRRPDGRLSTRAVNLILERIGAWHDAEQTEPNRRLGQLRPHALRHTFAFALSEQTGHDAYELERRLGHRSQRYIARYTNPPEEVAASYVEESVIPRPLPDANHCSDPPHARTPSKPPPLAVALDYLR